jgi:hypothetical protein
MPKLTISQAARVCGVARTTLQRAIRQGRLALDANHCVDTEALREAGYLVKAAPWDTATQHPDAAPMQHPCSTHAAPMQHPDAAGRHPVVSLPIDGERSRPQQGHAAGTRSRDTQQDNALEVALLQQDRDHLQRDYEQLRRDYDRLWQQFEASREQWRQEREEERERERVAQIEKHRLLNLLDAATREKQRLLDVPQAAPRSAADVPWPRPPTMLPERWNAILTYLQQAPGPQTARQVQQALNLPKSPRHTMHRMQAAGYLVRRSYGVYALPDAQGTTP